MCLLQISKLDTGDFGKARRDEGYDMLGAYNTADRVRIKKVFANGSQSKAAAAQAFATGQGNG